MGSNCCRIWSIGAKEKKITLKKKIGVYARLPFRRAIHKPRMFSVDMTSMNRVVWSSTILASIRRFKLQSVYKVRTTNTVTSTSGLRRRRELGRRWRRMRWLDEPALWLVIHFSRQRWSFDDRI